MTGMGTFAICRSSLAPELGTAGVDVQVLRTFKAFKGGLKKPGWGMIIPEEPEETRKRQQAPDKAWRSIGFLSPAIFKAAALP